MHLLRCSIGLLFAAKHVTEAFVLPQYMNIIRDNYQHHLDTQLSQLHATTDTDVDRLLQKARELRKQAASGEDELHNTLIRRKRTQDAATDAIIQQLFPDNDTDDGDGVCALCDRLREKRLASDMLVRVVERLHEREVAAKGLDHVEPSVHHDHVTFKRVAQPDDEELARIQGLVHRLIEAAEVLDKEFIEQKSECQGKITHSDIMHWGGGEIANILKDKAKDLGREHDEQFQKRLNSFYEAAKRKHSKDDIDTDSWRNEEVWK